MRSRVTEILLAAFMAAVFLLVPGGPAAGRQAVPDGRWQSELRAAILKEVRLALPWVVDLRLGEIRGLQRFGKKLGGGGGRTVRVVKIGKWNRRSGKMPVQVEASRDGRRLAQGWLSVEVAGKAGVYVPVHPLEKGQLVRWRDVRHQMIDCRRLDSHSLIDFPRQAVYETVRRVAAGQPLSKQDLRPHRLVTRGEMVTVVLEHDHIRVVTRGVALSQGCQDQLIMVRNPVSRRTYQARVVDAGQVRVAY